MRITCPACGGSGTLAPGAEGRRITCPNCGMKWTPALQGETDGLTGIAVFETAPGHDPERWATRWTIAAALGLLVGFLLPLAIGSPGHEAAPAPWVWDRLSSAGGGAALLELLPALLGIAVLVVLRMLHGRTRSLTIFWSSGGTYLVGIVLATRTGGWFGSGSYALTGRMDVVAVLLLTMGAAAIAAGNHLRRAYPRYRVPRLLTGLAGIAVILSCLLPGSGGDPLIGLIFDTEVWSASWLLPLLFLALMVLAVASLVGLRRLRDPSLLCRSLGGLARVLAIGFPIAILLAQDAPIGRALLIAVKPSLLLFSVLALAAVGLASWLEHVLAEERAAAATDPTALADLSSRLVHLQAARAHGLVSEEEFEQKRRRIIDSADV